MNVAVGGNNGFFPDAAVNKGGAEPKPWDNDSPTPMEDFWDNQTVWYPTWDTPLGAMEVDYIRVYQVTSSSMASVYMDNRFSILLVLSVLIHRFYW